MVTGALEQLYKSRVEGNPDIELGAATSWVHYNIPSNSQLSVVIPRNFLFIKHCSDTSNIITLGDVTSVQ